MSIIYHKFIHTHEYGESLYIFTDPDHLYKKLSLKKFEKKLIKFFNIDFEPSKGESIDIEYCLEVRNLK